MARASLRSDPRLRGRGRHRSPWTPRRLRPRAWYDAELGQPKYVGYVQLNGGSTDNISTPDSALNSFSNDIEVIMRVRPDDWTTGAIQTLVGKYLTTGNQRSWRFYISATGAIGLTASADGTAVTTVLVTPTTPFVDATWIWLRLRLDLTDGANSVGTVDIAADTGNNYTVPTSWTANGTNTGTTLAGIYNGTGVVEIGAFNSGTSERFAGRVGRCIVKSGFDGVVTSDFNADNCYGPGYSSVTTLPVDTNGYAHVPLSGVSGDYIYTADKASLDITGDIEIVVRVAMDDWTPASLTTLACKDAAAGAGTRGWHFTLLTGGYPRLYLSLDGTSLNELTSTAVVPFTDGEIGWLKVTRRTSDGRVQYFTAPDSTEEPTNWTKLGNDLTNFAGALAAVNAPVQIGQGPGTTVFKGKIYQAIVRDGIDGTTVADYNASLSTVDGQVDAYSNQWIINQSKYLGTWTLGIPKIYDRSSNNRAPATFGSGTNQPLYLPWDGSPSVYLTGASGNYVSCPDAAALDITGDIELVARVEMADWTPGFTGSFVGKWVAGGNQSYALQCVTTGRLRLYLSTTGYDLPFVESTVAPTISDGSTLWVKVTFRLSDRRTQFFTAPDQTAEPTSWTKLGADVTHAATSIWAGGAAVEIGSVNSGTSSVLTGKVYRAIVRNGIDGTTVADFDASQCGQSGFTDEQGNVWAVNRSTTGRKTVVQSPVANSARSVILLGTDDSETLNAGVMPPMTATTPASVLAVHRTWGTIASNSTILDTRAANALVPGLSLRFSGETAFAVLVDSATAITTATVAAVYGAKHVVGAVLDAANIYPVVDTTIGTASARTGNDETGTSTTLLNVRPGPVGYLDSEFFGVIAVSRALAATELGLISAYYGGGL